MQELIDIIYLNVEEDNNLEEIIYKVIEKCYEIKNIKGYIGITLTDNENIRKFNREYRNIDKETDVLSFPIMEKEELDNFKIDEDVVKQIMLGDIIISIPKVKEQANEYEHSFEREFAYMLVHAYCHLIGYDHIQEDDKIIMRQEEENILNQLKITR